MILKKTIFATALSLFISISTLQAATPSVEFMSHATWSQFLETYVDQEGAIDFAGIQEDPTLLDRYLAELKGVDERVLNQQKREERLAFWLNAFHAGVIEQIRRHYPAQREIHKISTFWDAKIIAVGISDPLTGEMRTRRFSLNEIRTSKLMDVFRDEKIHTALACGAKSCPKMLREAFTRKNVEGLLYFSAKEFVNDPSKNEIIPGSKKIKLSRIFKWYGADFKLDFGRQRNAMGFSRIEHAVLSFISYYNENAEVLEFLEETNYKIKYLPFDWSLNEPSDS